VSRWILAACRGCRAPIRSTATNQHRNPKRSPRPRAAGGRSHLEATHVQRPFEAPTAPRSPLSYLTQRWRRGSAPTRLGGWRPRPAAMMGEVSRPRPASGRGRWVCDRAQSNDRSHSRGRLYTFLGRPMTVVPLPARRTGGLPWPLIPLQQAQSPHACARDGLARARR
jgi:hypothetical protein